MRKRAIARDIRSRVHRGGALQASVAKLAKIESSFLAGGGEIGRILVARGRDAADVAISTAFGPAQLVRFNVITEKLTDVRQRGQLKEAA